MSLEGVEFTARIAGNGAIQVAKLIAQVMRDERRTRGKVRLDNMLRQGKELKVFAVKDSDLKKFCTEAKKYGVLYTVLKDRDATDGITDIMVRAEDSSKINRIFERFQLMTVDMASVKNEIELSRQAPDKETPKKGTTDEPEMTKEEFVEQIFKTAAEEEKARTLPANPTEATTDESLPSEPTSAPTPASTMDLSRSDMESRRPSVRKELEEIQKERKERELRDKDTAKERGLKVPVLDKNKNAGGKEDVER